MLIVELIPEAGRGPDALKLLDHYRGIVQCDGYAAYKTIANAVPDEAITLAFCWAHLRRRFFDIAQGGPAPIASEALTRIAALYAIEKTIRGYSADQRRAMRQEKSKPLVLAFKAWLEQQLARVSGKATIADDIRYALNHWDGLTRFLDDGRIELDTNIVERRSPSLFSIVKMHCSLATIRAPRTGHASLRSSKLASCTVSTRKPTSPTCSPSSSTCGRPRALTSSCHGPGRRLSVPQTAKRRGPWRGASPGKEVSRQSRGKEDRLRYDGNVERGFDPRYLSGAVVER